jgi:hypothetical protein
MSDLDTKVRDEAALDRVLRQFAHVTRRDFDEAKPADRLALQQLATKLRKSDTGAAREGFAYLVRLGAKYPESRFASRFAAQECRVCDRLLDGRAQPTDERALTKEEALAGIGPITRTESHG